MTGLEYPDAIYTLELTTTDLNRGDSAAIPVTIWTLSATDSVTGETKIVDSSLNATRHGAMLDSLEVLKAAERKIERKLEEAIFGQRVTNDVPAASGAA